MNLEEYIKETSLAYTNEEIKNLFLSAINKYGYNKMHFLLLSDHIDIGLKSGIGIVHNYDNNFIEHYIENEFGKFDSALKYGAAQSDAFEFSEIEKKLKLSPIQRKILNFKKECGLYHSAAIPLRGCKNQIAAMVISSTKDADCDFNKDILTILSNQFYRHFKRINTKDENKQLLNILITETEREIIRLAAMGKSDTEIAILMEISKHTVNMHFRNIFTKMGINNRILVIVEALVTGLIAI